MLMSGNLGIKVKTQTESCSFALVKPRRHQSVAAILSDLAREMCSKF